MTEADLLKAIQGYANACRVSPATVTKRAVGNSRLFDQLRAGKSCTLATANRIVDHIKQNPPPPKKEDAAA